MASIPQGTPGVRTPLISRTNMTEIANLIKDENKYIKVTERADKLSNKLLLLPMSAALITLIVGTGLWFVAGPSSFTLAVEIGLPAICLSATPLFGAFVYYRIKLSQEKKLKCPASGLTVEQMEHPVKSDGEIYERSALLVKIMHDNTAQKVSIAVEAAVRKANTDAIKNYSTDEGIKLDKEKFLAGRVLEIPEDVLNDENVVCPISQEAVGNLKMPVKIDNTNTVYEAEYLIQYLEQSTKNPITRQEIPDAEKLKDKIISDTKLMKNSLYDYS